MDGIVDSGINLLNALGQAFCIHAGSAFVQSSVLIVVLLVLDVLLRKRVRAVVRYSVWMLVFVKLLLPPTLSLPTGIGYYWPRRTAVLQVSTKPVAEETAATPPVEMVRPQHVSTAIPSTDAVEVSGAGTRPSAVAPVLALPVAVRPALTWQAWVCLSWLSGVLALGICLWRRFQYVRKLVRESTPASDLLQDALAQCAAKLGLRRCPQLRLSDGAPGPVVCRLLRPVVLMPTTLADRMSEDRLRTVLVHELAHIKRADLWVNFVQTLLLVAYFYHPLLWLANAIVRRLREQAVDETVLVALDAEAEGYSTTLIDLAEMTFTRPILGLRLIGIAESRKALEGRIRHMMTQPKPRTARIGLLGLLAIAVGAAVLLPMARGQNKTEPLRFTKRLSNGVTAELLGVCHWPTEGPVCWKPDGSKLDRPLRVTKSHVRPGGNDYGFMLRVTGPDDLNMSWNRIKGADGWEGSCDVVTSDGKPLDDCTAAVANVKGGLETTALRIGFATGPWTTISSHDGQRMSTGGHTGVLWSQAFEDSGDTCIVATAEWLKDRTERITAIDRDGVTHTTPQGSVAMSNMDQMTARFPDLRPDQIREFQYQVRPYEWAQFNNVSLRPGERTEVQVQTAPASGAKDEPGLPDGEDLDARMESGTRLVDLDRALRIYADDHDDRFPDRMADAVDCYPINLPWLEQHVAYLGKGKTMSTPPDTVLAYDKTLLEKGEGTLALFADSHVDFVSAERFRELGIETARESLPNIFVLSSARVPFNVFDAIISRTQDWTWNKTGRFHSKEAYDKIFDGTDHRTPRDILVLVFTLESRDRIPAGYEDLLPMPWAEIEQMLRQGRTVELTTEARGLHVILLAAPRGEQLKRLIGQSQLLIDSKNVARSAVTGCDIAIEDFKVRADPDLGTYGATVSIRNRGTVTCPKIAVYFYRGDPEIAKPMTHGAGPIESGQVWNESSSQFGLREGANELYVVLDPANLLQEPDEANNRATLRVVIRDGQVAEQSIVSSEISSVSLEARVESATRLSDLGKALLIYANDHDDTFPEQLSDLREEVRVGMSWLLKNVTYLGKDMSPLDHPARVLAYDKTLLGKGTGTNVLYLDSHVAFETPRKLESLGIKPVPKSAEALQEEATDQARVAMLGKLKRLALAAIMYADEHENTFADDLNEFEAYLGDQALSTWAKQNVAYVARGAKWTGGSEGSKKLLAYWRTAPVAMGGTATVFQDGHAEFVRGPRLQELGIRIEPQGDR